jgi:hypothetical protein
MLLETLKDHNTFQLIGQTEWRLFESAFRFCQFLCKCWQHVSFYCHRVSTQLQLNIYYQIHSRLTVWNALKIFIMTFYNMPSFWCVFNLLWIYILEFEVRRLSDWKLVFVLMCFCDIAGVTRWVQRVRFGQLLSDAVVGCKDVIVAWR